MAILIHIWVDWFVDTWGTQYCPRRSQGTRVIILWNATQAQRDHNIIHARNFCVQPHAIMGSGKVEYVVGILSMMG